MKIEAALTRAANAPFTIEPIDLKADGVHDVLVHIVATGICHTDLTMLAESSLPWPGVLGHEGAGIVERVGSAVEGVAVGDHVVLTTSSCGACANCLADLPSWCLRFVELNMGGGCRADGGCSHSQHGHALFGRFFGQSAFATYAVVGARNIIRVPRDLPLELLAPLGCGVQTGAGAVLNTLAPPPGSSIAVFGVGAVGLSAVMAARIAGCTRIVAVDRKPERLALAAEFGATELVDASALERDAVVTAASGVAFAVEASGVPAVMEQAIEVLAMNGTVALVGVAMGARITVDPMAVQGRNLTIRSSVMTGAGATPQAFVPRLIDHMRGGALPIERMIRTYDFRDINAAVEDARTGAAIKPVLRFA